MRFVETEFAELRARNEELERKVTNMFREATVTKVHEDDAMAELDADGLPTDKLPWLARAGKQREWDPLTEGERVVLISLGGEPGTGLILPGGFSNKFPPNHNKLGEHKRSVGDKVSTTTTDKDKVSETEKVRVSQNADSHDMKVGDKVSVVADLEKNVIKVGETLLASLGDKNISQALKTVVKQKLLVASGGLLG
jgi:phage baseplate assembly protein V